MQEIEQYGFKIIGADSDNGYLELKANIERIAKNSLKLVNSSPEIASSAYVVLDEPFFLTCYIKNEEFYIGVYNKSLDVIENIITYNHPQITQENCVLLEIRMSNDILRTLNQQKVYTTPLINDAWSKYMLSYERISKDNYER